MAVERTIKIRRDTSTNWSNNNPIPHEGEWCLETDTRKLKIGDGTSNYNALDFIDKDLQDHIADGTIHFTEGSIRLTGIGEGIDTPSDGDVVIYDGVNNEFENRLLVESDIPNLSAGKITSGTFADARISESSVTQHESALTITSSQISDINEGVYDEVAKILSSGSGISIATDDITNGITVTNTGTSGGGAQFSGAEATRDTSYSLSNNSATLIPWDGEVFDTDNYHDAGTNPTRLTVPNAGKYYVGGTIEFSGWATLADGRLVIQLYQSGNWIREFTDSNVDADGSDGPAESFGTIVDAAQGDYFELQVRQASGSSRDITTRSVFYAARLQGSGPSQLADLNDVTSVNYTSGRVLRANGSEYVSAPLATSDLNNDLNWTSYDSSDFDTDFGNKTTDDLDEGVNDLYFTDERAQDAVGNILTDTSSISFTYDDATPQITATVLESGVDHNSLNNYAQNEHRVWENSITQNIHEDNITELSVTQHESALTIDASTQLNNQVPYANLPISSADVSNWNTAYSERGSQIAGTNLTWNGTQLDATDTNTQLSQEEVEDFAFGRTITNGTQTLINVTYQDASNALDFVVNSDLSQYDNSTSGFFNQSSQIDHDQTTNYVANEHIDWTTDQGATNINDANITQASITQHESALTITESQITDGSILARVGSDETITGSWHFNNTTTSNAGFEVSNGSGVWFNAKVSNDTDSAIFRGIDSGDNVIAYINLKGLDGTGSGSIDLIGDWELNGNTIWTSGDFDNPFPNGGDQAVGSSDNVNFNDGTFGGNVSIAGDLTVSGTQFTANVETVEIQDNLGFINFGETGAGVTEGFAGWEVDRGTNDPYRWGFEESSGYWKIGQYYTDLSYSGLSGTFNLHEEIVGESSGAKSYIVSDSSSTLRLKGKTGSFSATETITGQDSGATATVDSTSITDELQAVATREDNPTNNALAYWNSTDMLFETSSNLTWDGTDLSINGNNAFHSGDTIPRGNLPSEIAYTDESNTFSQSQVINDRLDVTGNVDNDTNWLVELENTNIGGTGDPGGQVLHLKTARGAGMPGSIFQVEGRDNVFFDVRGDGNIGVFTTSPSYTFDVNGTVNATTLSYGGQDTDLRYAPIAEGGSNIAGTNLSWDGTQLNATDTDTTYTDGAGLDLSGTTFSLSINTLTSLGASPASTDLLAIYDSSASAHKEISYSELESGLTITESQITGANFSNWNTAYSWGDHSTQGYLTDITGEVIGDLSNVSTGTLSSGDFLRYDGTNFVNTTLSSGDLPSHTHVLADITDSGDAAAKGVTGLDANAVTGTAGTAGNFIQWNGDGDAVDSGNSASDFVTGAAGSNHQIQYNNGGTFGANSQFFFNDTEIMLGVGDTPSSSIPVFPHSTIHSGSSMAMGWANSEDIVQDGGEDPDFVQLDDSVGSLFVGANGRAQLDIYLPDASLAQGRFYLISVYDFQNASIVFKTPNGGTINGGSQLDMTTLSEFRSYKVFVLTAGLTGGGSGEWAI